ncbi:MAG: putative molybdenum carrier protein [Mariniblastus sp.]
MSFPLIKIVSGAQTGVDRAALDVAIFLDIAHGGWCPLGRRAEDGSIPAIYQLQETPQRNYAIRTEKNVVQSDGTLILFRDQISGGTELTIKFAKKHKRPFFCVDLSCSDSNLDSDLISDPGLGQKPDADPVPEPANDVALLDWIVQNNIGVMNVAGPRESSSPGIAKLAEAFLVKALSPK